MTVRRRRVVLATTNRHKAREIASILAPFGLEVEVPERLPEVVEDGDTFEANALKKARSAARATGRAAMADDSGLVVAALGGEPGVRSARYAGEDATDEANNRKLLDELARRGLTDPAAAFVCHAVLVAPDGTVLATAAGRVEGTIRGPARGSNGFGYDPLFHHVSARHPAPGLRFAELSAADKDAISHRGRAFRAIGEAVAALPDGAL